MSGIRYSMSEWRHFIADVHPDESVPNEVTEAEFRLLATLRRPGLVKKWRGDRLKDRVTAYGCMTEEERDTLLYGLVYRNVAGPDDASPDLDLLHEQVSEIPELSAAIQRLVDELSIWGIERQNNE